MGFAAQFAQHLLEVEERGAGQGQHLLTAADLVDAIHAERVDEDHIAVVAALGSRSLCETGVGRLENDDLVRRDAGLQNLPKLDEPARAYDGERIARSGAEALAEPLRCLIPGQHVAASDDSLQPCDDVIILDHASELPPLKTAAFRTGRMLQADRC